jgi:hypothetical protein
MIPMAIVSEAVRLSMAIDDVAEGFGKHVSSLMEVTPEGNNPRVQIFFENGQWNLVVEEVDS